MIMTAVITVIGAYLLGSINFAVIFTRCFTNSDVRDFGSGNAGTTNAMRVGGVLPGVLTFACDILKGFVACYVGRVMFGYIASNSSALYAVPIYGAYLCGVACILGHVFPIFFDFKGGKGVAVSVGIYLVCCPIAILIGLAIFAVSFIISRIVSLSSLIATVIVIVLSLILYDTSALFMPQAVLSAVMGVIVILKHSENIKRLLAGEEKKLTVRRK